MFSLFDNGDILDLEKFDEIITKISTHKVDAERQYVMGLFFPYKIDRANYIKPFPIVSYYFCLIYSLRIRLYIKFQHIFHQIRTAASLFRW